MILKDYGRFIDRFIQFSDYDDLICLCIIKKTWKKCKVNRIIFFLIEIG